MLSGGTLKEWLMKYTNTRDVFLQGLTNHMAMFPKVYNDTQAPSARIF